MRRYAIEIALFLLSAILLLASEITQGVSLAPLTGVTASIGGSALLAGACASGTVAVANSTTSMAVVATPSTYPGDGNLWLAYVSTNGTVTVKVCAILALTPTATTYAVRVIQ